MAVTKNVPLTTPIKVGATEYDELTLTESTSAHILDAQEEAEKVVMTTDGPALVASPALVGQHILRRQVCIGDLKGVDLDILKRLSPQDLKRVQDKAEELDYQAAISAKETLDALERRGRSGEQDGRD
jgi:phage FluMu protein gp41